MDNSLPNGFIMDNAQQPSGLPQGFMLDSQPNQAPINRQNAIDGGQKLPYETTGEYWARGIGQGAQAGLEGLGSVFDLPRIPLNAMGANIPSVTDTIRAHSSFAPPTDIWSNLTRGATSAMGSMLPGAALAESAAPVVAGVGQTLTQNPVSQIAALSGGEVARGIAQNAGIGPIGQMAAQLVGTIPGAMGAGLFSSIKPEEIPNMTSQQIRSLASQSYKNADQLGGTFSPQFTNKFLDTMSNAITEPERVTNAMGTTPAQSIVHGITDEFQDSPMSLAEAHGIDKRLGQAINEQVDPRTGKLNEVGNQLFDFQTKLRGMIANPDSGDIVGSSAGMDAVNQGRQLWAQSARMGDLERIIERSQLMENPSQGIKTGFRQLATNKARMNGFTDQEKSAIEDAAKRGLAGDFFNTFGSRLGPLIAGGIGSVGGPMGSAAAAVTSFGLSKVSRNIAEQMQLARANNAIDLVANRPMNFSPIESPPEPTPQAQMQITYQPRPFITDPNGVTSTPPSGQTSSPMFGEGEGTPYMPGERQNMNVQTGSYQNMPLNSQFGQNAFLNALDQEASNGKYGGLRALFLKSRMRTYPDYKGGS